MLTTFSRRNKRNANLRTGRRAYRPLLEALEDRSLLAAITVTGTGDALAVDGLVTLREAITSANNNANLNADVVAVGAYGADTINFNIGGTISPVTGLPDIAGPVTIDATGWNITLDGSATTAPAHGLFISGDGSTVRNLTVKNFYYGGISIFNGSGNTVDNNRVIDNNPYHHSRNDQGYAGISVLELPGGSADNNTVTNNVIDHNLFGLGIGGGASGNTFSGNTITGSKWDGVALFSDADVQQATVTSGNTLSGNTITGNANGIAVSGGVDRAINLGVMFNHLLGNTIENNRENGVLIDGFRATSNTVWGNIIRNNTGHGVRISGDADSNTIGGTLPGQSNTIHGNQGDGVMVQDWGYDFFPCCPAYHADGPALNNSIRGNNIDGNTGLPIDLNDDDGTANDSLDGDSGPNHLQNRPQVSVAHSGATTFIAGSLHSLPDTLFTLDFYASSAGSQRQLGTLVRATNASGNVSFDGLFNATVAGEVVMATATDPTGNTSEFSAAELVTDLVVNGTAGDDTYIFQAHSSGAVEVFLTDTTHSHSQGIATQVEVSDFTGSDTYIVNFDGWTGNVTLSDFEVTGTDTLTVFGTEANETLNKQAGFVQWRPTAAPTFQTRVDFAGFESVTLNAAAGNDTIHDPGTDTTILGGEGDDTIVIDATFGNGVVVDGGEGSDTYVVLFGNLAGPVTVADSGASGSDSLTVNGTAGDDAITLAANEVQRGTERVIIAAPVESLVVNAGDGSDTMSVVDFTAPISSLGLDGGAGTNQVSIEGSLPPGVELDIVGATQTVQIHVQRNADNLASSGVIAVAIYTTATFDATQVAAGSVVFAGAHAAGSALADADGDGDLDMVLHFRTQETNLRALYEQLLADDLNGDGVLDSSHKELDVSLTGQTVDDVLIEGFDALDLFLSGKKLRELLDELAAAGTI